MTKYYSQGWLPSAFNDFFDNAYMTRANATAPSINVAEDKEQYTVELAAPGMTKEDFNIHLDENGDLVIGMEKKANETEEKKERKYLRREFSYVKFQQTLVLPDNVDKSKIAAGVKDGILTIDLPKVNEEEVKLARKIEVM
ncbi:MAG: Hsp20/alpha crystallin family protein [Bacteroidales bacterium]|nr:Hsp20/alpha crystallin family protein [Bacteroidales bacterium]